MGVIEVRSPGGDVWWVKRAWVPRYRGLRDRVGEALEGTEPRWYNAHLRLYARGYDRWVPEKAVDALNAMPFPGQGGPGDPGSAASIADPANLSPELARALSPDPTAGGGDFSGSGGLGGGGDVGVPTYPTHSAMVDLGGGGDLSGGAVLGPDAAAPLADLGGSAASAGGGAGGGGGDGGGGGGGDSSDLGLVILAVVALVGLALLVGWVLLPVIMAVVDGAVLLLAVLVAGAARVLLRRPWDVVATCDLPDGLQQVRRWEMRGYRRAGHARDDVARALETGTDTDLAVARVVVREPVPADPAGIARSERELHWR